MKRKSILLALNLFLTLLSIQTTHAQNETEKPLLNLNVDLVNRYIWRGLNYCSTPSIQPSLSFSSKNGLLNFGAWSSYSNSSNYGEVDLFLTMNWKHVSVSIWDYFPMNEDSLRNNYFSYEQENTRHFYEASLTLANFKIPVKFLGSIFFYGADRDLNGDQQYSLYFETSYDFKISNQILTLFIGGTPYKGLYGDSEGIVNFGCTAERAIKITENFDLPIKGSLIVNPMNENIYFTITVSI